MHYTCDCCGEPTSRSQLYCWADQHGQQLLCRTCLLQLRGARMQANREQKADIISGREVHLLLFGKHLVTSGRCSEDGPNVERECTVLAERNS